MRAYTVVNIYPNIDIPTRAKLGLCSVYAFCAKLGFCFYLSLNAAASLENIDKVCKVLTPCINISFPTFVLGDFNLPYIDWSVPVSHAGVNHQAFVQFCINNPLNQLITEPIYSDGNILDLLLCNYFSSNILISCCIDMPFCSSCDHSSIHFHLK